jgi:hypothetical protein
MKKLFVPALAVVLLSSCSDKNDKQPKLGAAARTPINQPMNNMGAMQAMPQMIGAQNSMPASGFMDMTGGQPIQNQAEVFVNNQVAFGTAPSAFPNEINANQNINIPTSSNLLPTQAAMQPASAPAPAAPMLAAPIAPASVSQTAPIAKMPAPVNTGKTGYLPPEVTGSDTSTEPPITYITNRRNVPASLVPSYKNPLNTIEEEEAQIQNNMPMQSQFAAPQAMPAPMPPMMMQPQMGQVAPVFNLPPQPMQNMQMPAQMPMMQQPMQIPQMGMNAPMMQQPQMGQPMQQDPMWQPPMMLPAQLN